MDAQEIADRRRTTGVFAGGKMFGVQGGPSVVTAAARAELFLLNGIA